jgi:hypothetical protein
MSTSHPRLALRRLRRGALALASSAWLLPAALPGAAAAAPVRLADRVEIGAASGASRAVQDECGLQTALPDYVRSASGDVELVSGRPSGGRVLELSVVEVHAPGGGPFSGPKWMTVAATLRDGATTVATARAKRITSGPFGGTCDQLQKVARAIAVDLAAWLKDPTRGATLGDAP